MGLAPDVLASINKARTSRGEPPLARGPSFYDPTPLEDIALIDRIADAIWGKSKPKREKNEMPKREWKRENVWLRMLLMAPTGGGKTLGALAVASTLFDGTLPIVGIDTEHERMKLYADVVNLADYRVIDGEYSPESYIREIDEVEREFQGGILVVDSVTHEWNNTGGILEIVDKGKGGNWKEGTPRHNRFVERLMATQMHLIVCCRAKMKYDWSSQEVDGRRRTVIEKLGVGPEQRDSFLYEFDVVADIDVETHEARFSNRCRPLVGRTMTLVPDLDDLRAPNPVSAILTEWLSEGDPPEPPEAANPVDIDELENLLLAEGREQSVIERGFAAARALNRGEISPAWVAEKLAAARDRAAPPPDDHAGDAVSASAATGAVS